MFKKLFCQHDYRYKLDEMGKDVFFLIESDNSRDICYAYKKCCKCGHEYIDKSRKIKVLKPPRGGASMSKQQYCKHDYWYKIDERGNGIRVLVESGDYYDVYHVYKKCRKCGHEYLDTSGTITINRPLPEAQRIIYDLREELGVPYDYIKHGSWWALDFPNAVSGRLDSYGEEAAKAFARDALERLKQGV